MNNSVFNSINMHKKIRFALIGICIIIAVFFLVMNINYQKHNKAEISNVSVKSQDSYIHIEWNTPFWSFGDSIKIIISDGEHEFLKELSSFRHTYNFKEGIHGTRYSISIQAVFGDGSVGQLYTSQAMFLDYDKLPDLPIITINTTNGLEPTYIEADKPDEKLWGETIDNNEYVACLLTHLRRRRCLFRNGSARSMS